MARCNYRFKRYSHETERSDDWRNADKKKKLIEFDVSCIRWLILFSIEILFYHIETELQIRKKKKKDETMTRLRHEIFRKERL